MKRNVELEAAEALLDVGILLPLLRFRLPGGRERVLRVTMRRPCLGGQMRIVRPLPEAGNHGPGMGCFLRRRGACLFRPACQTPFADPCADDMSRLSVRTPAGPRGGLVDPVEGTLRVPDRSPALVPQNAGTRDFTSIIESAERIDPFRYEASRPKRAGKGS